ncbi:MAG TPA: PIG-L family deacetylase [Candidatus Saccharimonadales bacterium]|nr:PIG-L family deacetylase [Candidatus Saccharimonadales bacterium]
MNDNVRRYLVIGISVYAFELLVIVAAEALGAGSVGAVALAFWLGLLVSFGLQKIVAFGDKRLRYKVLIPQLAAFSLLVLFNFGFTVMLTKLLDDYLPAVWCRTIALGLTTIWNFYLYKTRIFNWKGKPARRRKPAITKRLKFYQRQFRKRYRAWRSKPRVKKLRKYANRPKVGKVYLSISLLILFATTLLWGVLGARLQQINADQLVNARLFQDKATLSGAIFPDQHSFLIKWPLFYIIKIFNYSPAAFMWATVLTVLLTVAVFVYVLWRIERRPLALGSLCLALASVLLLVPAQPYAGALLPVNMAMLATRNLEYVLFLASLVCLVKAPVIRSRQFYGAAILLGVLVASDRLFLSVSAAGALLGLLVYSVRKQRELVTLAARWLLLTGIAGVVAALLIAAVNHSDLTEITGSQTGPYGIVREIKSLVLGIIFAVGGVLTNFGANPAYDVTAIGQIPRSLLKHFFSPAAPAYLVNLLILLFGTYIGGRFLWNTGRNKKSRIKEVSWIRQLSVLLLWSSLAAIGLFIMADHYHPVDARYLTICLFALFVVLAGWSRPRRVDAELVAICSPVLLFSIICGVVGAIQTYNVQEQGLESISRRNQAVARTLASHHVNVLVGDYWRVLPVQSLSKERQQQVMPLQTCAQPRETLTSRKWQPDLRHTSFAYLLSFDKSLTDYPQCNFEEVVKAYGVPNSSALVDGSLAHPKELLLFYDRGISSPKTLSTSTKTTEGVLPIALRDLTRTRCQSPTIMNIVAHQDDDLLFMNPDLQHDIAAGHCVRTVYLTAGDAGGHRPYWLAREQGSEAAYSEMTGSKAAWMHQTVRLPDGQFVTVANPRGNDKISLIFLHLPDGNVDGRGFRASQNKSLAALEGKRIGDVQAVDFQSVYSGQELTDALIQLMRVYEPSQIRTQSNHAGEYYRDHSDHQATGRFVVRAHQQYGSHIPLVFYMGYPVHELPPNVEGEALDRKVAAFSAYAAYDNSVCRTLESCQQNTVYGIYLLRQYRSPH